MSYGFASDENSGRHTGSHDIRSKHEFEIDGAPTVHRLAYGNIVKVVEKSRETTKLKIDKKALTVDSLCIDSVEDTEDVPCPSRTAATVLSHDGGAPLTTNDPSYYSKTKGHKNRKAVTAENGLRVFLVVKITRIHSEETKNAETRFIAAITCLVTKEENTF